MNPRLTLSLSRACATGAAAILVFDVLDSIYLFFAASRTWDLAGGRTVSLNFLKGFTLYVTPTEYWLFVGSMACAGALLIAALLLYARLKRVATGVTDVSSGRR